MKSHLRKKIISGNLAIEIRQVTLKSTFTCSHFKTQGTIRAFLFNELGCKFMDKCIKYVQFDLDISENLNKHLTNLLSIID